MSSVRTEDGHRLKNEGSWKSVVCVVCKPQTRDLHRPGHGPLGSWTEGIQNALPSHTELRTLQHYHTTQEVKKRLVNIIPSVAESCVALWQQYITQERKSISPFLWQSFGTVCLAQGPLHSGLLGKAWWSMGRPSKSQMYKPSKWTSPWQN